MTPTMHHDPQDARLGRLACGLGAASLVCGMVLASSSSADAAQSASDRFEAPRDLRRPIDQGLADRNPLGTSLRSLPQTIDAGRSFGRIYADPRRPGRYLRRQGGLSAVFPQSVYVGESADGIPIVPPGTVFELGWEGSAAATPSPRTDAPPKELVPPGENRLDPSTHLAPGRRWKQDRHRIPTGDREFEGVEPPPAGPTAGYGDPLATFEALGEVSSGLADRTSPRFLRDRAYRVRRLDDLIGRAVAASLHAD